MPSTSAPTPDTGYSLSLIVAAAGVPCVTIAMMGAIFVRAGRDPIDAAGFPGQVAFACSFALLFASRLIFSPKSSAGLRNGVRMMISAVLAIEFSCALVALAVGATGPGSADLFLRIFMFLALACQVGTLTWLVRYRTR